ncbi:sigma-70 family RNA polymerase sigma factor [Nocardioides sp. AN3]
MSSSTITERGDAGQAPGGVWAESADAFDRWIAGDPSALDDLVRVMTPVLWHVVRAYRLDAETAEDVIQSTWLAFIRRSSAILDTAAVGGWLTMTARREAWRVAKGSGRATPTDEEGLAAHLPRQRSAETDVVEADRRDRLWGAVDGLPERCRRLLRVVAFENRPDYASLASDLGMPIGSIGPTRGRCLAKLRVALIEAGEL